MLFYVLQHPSKPKQREKGAKAGASDVHKGRNQSKKLSENSPDLHAPRNVMEDSGAVKLGRAPFTLGREPVAVRSVSDSGVSNSAIPSADSRSSLRVITGETAPRRVLLGSVHSPERARSRGGGGSSRSSGGQAVAANVSMVVARNQMQPLMSAWPHNSPSSPTTAQQLTLDRLLARFTIRLDSIGRFASQYIETQLRSYASGSRRATVFIGRMREMVACLSCVSSFDHKRISDAVDQAKSWIADPPSKSAPPKNGESLFGKPSAYPCGCRANIRAPIFMVPRTLEDFQALILQDVSICGTAPMAKSNVKAFLDTEFSFYRHKPSDIRGTVALCKLNRSGMPIIGFIRIRKSWFQVIGCEKALPVTESDVMKHADMAYLRPSNLCGSVVEDTVKVTDWIIALRYDELRNRLISRNLSAVGCKTLLQFRLHAAVSREGIIGGTAMQVDVISDGGVRHDHSRPSKRKEVVHHVPRPLKRRAVNPQMLICRWLPDYDECVEYTL